MQWTFENEINMQNNCRGKNLFKDFKVVKDRPVYIQLKDYLKKMIMKGHLLGDQKKFLQQGN